MMSDGSGESLPDPIGDIAVTHRVGMMSLPIGRGLSSVPLGQLVLSRVVTRVNVSRSRRSGRQHRATRINAYGGSQIGARRLRQRTVMRRRQKGGETAVLRRRN